MTEIPQSRELQNPLGKEGLKLLLEAVDAIMKHKRLCGDCTAAGMKMDEHIETGRFNEEKCLGLLKQFYPGVDVEEFCRGK